MTCPDTRIQPDSPGLKDLQGVTSGHERLCIDCKFCIQGYATRSAALWECGHPGLGIYAATSWVYCLNTRWRAQGYRNEPICGPDGAWFEDAITGEKP